MSELILLIPILLPLLAGLLAGFLPAMRDDRKLYPFVLAVLSIHTLAAVSLALLPAGAFHSAEAAGLLSISFRMDDVSRLFSVLGSVAWLITGIYSFRYMKHEDEHPRFYAFYLMVVGLLNALDYAGNLFTMYLSFECMTLCSMPLVLHIRSREAVQAGMKYLYYSIAGAFLGLFGFLILGTYGDPLSFTPGGLFTAEMIADRKPLFLLAVFLMIVGFCTKGGMFPMHAWLPSAHPIAPAPASAQLSAVITKAGVLCVIRTVYHIVGAELLRGTWVQTTWILLALITIFMGSMMAYREQNLKKRLAYSTISQVSYVYLGLAFGTPAAVLGALLHVVFHMASKSALFLCVGAITHNTGKIRADEIRGMGREMPFTFWCWTLASLTLIGIPPTSAFLSKWYLATGAMESAAIGTAGLSGVLTWLAPLVLLVSALLTAGYLLPVTVQGFFPGRNFKGEDVTLLENRYSMIVPMGIFSAAAVALGIYTEPLIRFLSQINL